MARRERFAGYREGLEEAGIAFKQELVWSPTGERHYGDAESAELGKLAVTQLIEIARPPTAIMAINDMYAIGVITGARELGLVVPEDVSVVGFDDITLASFFQPPLTTVAQPLAEMARAMMKLVLDDRNSWHDGTRSSIVVAPRLIVRASSGPPAPDAPARLDGKRKPNRADVSPMTLAMPEAGVGRTSPDGVRRSAR